MQPWRFGLLSAGSRSATVAAVAVVAFAATVSGCGSSTTSTRAWTVQNVWAPPSGNTRMYAVSCYRTCTAVGEFYGGSEDRRLLPVIARSGGRGWEIQSASIPPKTKFAELSAVSCSSSTSCTAVGGYTTRTDTSNTEALIERWNGDTWSTQSVASKTGGPVGLLRGISCSSPTACIAVGDSVNTHSVGTPLAAQWNGTRWSAQEMQAVTVAAGHGITELNSVSCSSFTSCTAVGSIEPRTGMDALLIERWNGKTWAMQMPPKIAGAAKSYLASVSCPATSYCVAVGGFAESEAGPDHPIALKWDGKAWSIQSLPKPVNVAESTASSVSCSSTTDCAIVGKSSNPTTFNPNVSFPFVQHWNGSTWVFQPTPGLVDPRIAELNGVSCTADGICTSVGNYLPFGSLNYIAMAMQYR